jgi:predicted deacetylase
MTLNSPSYRSLVVSVHDVSPLTHKKVDMMLRDLRDWGVEKTSLLVIPDHHQKGHFLKNFEFCEWLRQKVTEGHEAVVHGYYHQRPRKLSESASERVITSIYTAGEGEFFDLEESAASERLLQAKAEFTEAGLSPIGFIAPAWLLGAEAERAVKSAGFDYTTRLSEVSDLRNDRVMRSQSLVYSVRAGWRRQISLLWNAFLFRRLQTASLMRLGLHPPDRDFSQIWRQIQQLALRALADRDAITYQTWMQKWRENK